MLAGEYNKTYHRSIGKNLLVLIISLWLKTLKWIYWQKFIGAKYSTVTKDIGTSAKYSTVTKDIGTSPKALKLKGGDRVGIIKYTFYQRLQR